MVAGVFLLNPFRRLYQKPEIILAPLAEPGMTVLEVGPGMGFFSLPLARLAGSGGKVICVDVQEKMLHVLKRRAEAAGLAERIVARSCTSASLSLDDLGEQIDFAFVFAVVHEVTDQASLECSYLPSERLPIEPKERPLHGFLEHPFHFIQRAEYGSLQKCRAPFAAYLAGQVAFLPRDHFQFCLFSHNVHLHFSIKMIL